MKLNPLSAALEKAEQNNPPLCPNPPPPTPPPPPPRSFPPLKRVESGLINRKPVNKQAALVMAPAPWWAIAPYRAEPPQGKTLPEVVAQHTRAVEHIRKLEQINAKLRLHVKDGKTEFAEQLKKDLAQIEQLQKANTKLTEELEKMSHQLKVAALWEKI